ncbi:disease resistance protein RGA2-like [Chenopodium quinoa]|nr:disease resistance protein RGA2-like [Chenopodium quinoa]
MDSAGPYMLGDLTERDSWLLFQKIAFTQWQEPGVEAIGEEIAKMCMNVPLVIRSIGGLLAGKQTLQEWKTFRDDQLKHFSSYGRDVIQTLKLSFDQLDARQKLCVAYCSLFPKGFVYDEDQMVRLWISLGYVVPQYRSQSLEEAASAYMLNLVNCGFFKIEQTYDFGTGVRLTMHNMMHDLVLSVSGFRYKMADSDTREFDEQVRHLSFGGTISESWVVPSSLFRTEHLQSFLLVVSRHCKLTLKNLSINDRSILRLKSLRVLDLHRLGLKIVPRSLGELQCLRYLNLSYNPMVKLPNSITRLVNLLSLDLFGCYKLEELPKDMSRLVRLRHLTVGYCNALSHMPKGLGNLTDLRTLDMFIQGEQNSENGSKADCVGGLAELNSLKNLMGKLTLRIFGRSMDTVSEAKAANLKSKDKLLGLNLEFIDGSLKHDEIVIEDLQPNSNLKELLIYGYAGERLPSWMLDRLHFWLPNLVSIWILQCEGCRYLCSFGRLPHLKNLNLLDLDNVEYIENCSGSNESSNDILHKHHAPLFPSLENLWLRNMPKLKGWKRIISNSEADSRQPTQNNLLERKLAFPRLKHMQVDKIKWVLLITGEFRGFTLEQLTVSRCEDLNAIPEWTTNLSSLKMLTLENCSKKLQERYLKPTGEDWPKIQHIPTISIFGSGGPCLQREYEKAG